MSVFDQFGLAAYKPKVRQLILKRIDRIPLDDIRFVLVHDPDRIKQFLSLVLTAGEIGALRYLKTYGGQVSYHQGLGAPVDIGQFVQAAFEHGEQYSFLQLAEKVSEEHSIPLDHWLKGRVKSELRSLFERGVICRIDSRNLGGLAIWARSHGEITQRTPSRRQAWAREVEALMADNGPLTIVQMRQILGLPVSDSAGISDHLARLRKRGEVVVVGDRRPYQYQFKKKEDFPCCG